MNTHLSAGPECVRIIREFEKGPAGVRLTPEGAALEAYLCPSGQWTVGFGCSFWEDGTAVKRGDTITEDRVVPLLYANLRMAEDYVRKHVTRELTQYQFDALVSFRFNTRETTLRNSTRLLPNVNLGRIYDVADAFTAFVYGSGSHNGKPYDQAMRGLLRRRLCEALLFLGYDWADAVDDDSVALPKERKLTPDGSKYRDYIDEAGKTKLAQVLTRAMRHPLPPPQPPAPVDEVVTGALFEDAPVSEPAAPVVAPSSGVVAEGAGSTPPRPAVPPPPSTLPKPSVATPGIVKAGTDGTKPKSVSTVPPTAVSYTIDPEAGLKPLDESDRAKGYLWQQIGRGIIRAGAAGAFGTTSAGAFAFVSNDAVMTEVAISLFVPAAVAGSTLATGFVAKSYGDWKRRRGEEAASQALY